MRYMIVVLVFIILACSKRESRSEAATETEARAAAETGAVPALEAEPHKAQLTWVEPPTVELVGAGKPPLRKIRWSFQEGAKEVLVVSTRQVHQMRGGPWDDRFVPTGIVQTIDFATNAVSADGSAEVAFHIREVAELETPDANSPSLLGAEGWTGTYKIDSTGVIQDLVLVPSPGSKYTPPQMAALNGAIRWTVFPIPTAAIGVGAKWTVTQVVHEDRIPMNLRMAIELVDLTGSDMLLRVEIKGSGTRKDSTGDKEQTISMDVDVRHLVKVSSTKLVPRSSEFENHTIQTVKVAGVDGPMGQLDVIIDRTVKMQSN